MAKKKSLPEITPLGVDTSPYLLKMFEKKLLASMPALDSDEELKDCNIPAILRDMNFTIQSSVPLPDNSSVTVEFEFIFQDVRYANVHQPGHNGKPIILTPVMVRSQDENYELKVYVDIVQKMYIIRNGLRDEYPKGHHTYSSCHLTNIPLMVMSKYCPLRKNLGKIPLERLGECPYEKGGYYIMKEDITFKFGEEILSNYIFYSKSPRFTHEVSTKSVDSERFSQMYKVHMFFIDKYDARKEDSPFEVEEKDRTLNRVIEFHVPSVLKKRIPLYILFRAYGILSDAEITHMILGSDYYERPDLIDFLVPSIESASIVKTQESAIKFILKLLYPKSLNDSMRAGYTKTQIVNDILLHQILMHTGTDAHAKAVYLGLMARKLIRGVLGEIEYDDRDDYAFKRYIGPNRRLSETFYFSMIEIVTKTRESIKTELTRNIAKRAGAEDILDTIAGYTYVAFSNITSKPTAKFRAYMTQGKFPERKRKGTKNKYIEGVTERHSESPNHIERLSSIRRLSFPTSSVCLGGKPNALHPTQWGFVCPYQTPDGGNIGVLKHLSCSSTITSEKGREKENIMAFIEKQDVLLVSQISPKLANVGTPILHNGIPIAYTDNPFVFDATIRSARRKGLLPQYTSLSYDVDDRIYYIWTVTGRLVRPVMTVYRDSEGNVSLPAIEYLKNSSFKNDSFDNMFFDTADRPALFEYIDAHESKNRLIAESSDQVLINEDRRKSKMSYYKYDYCEIHPVFVLSFAAGLVPYLNNMPYPRALYQSCPMQKGMLSKPFSNIAYRTDKTSQEHIYPMHPHVRTLVYNAMDLDAMPAYMELMVAICDATGDNQEDSIIMNRASIERGFGQLIYYKKYSQNEDREALGESAKVFCNPLTLHYSVSNPEIYHALSKTGIPKKNVYIKDGDVLISMISKGANGEKLHPRNTIYHGAPGYIDAVDTIGPKTSPRAINVRVRVVRKIQIGDKLASRFAQKGTIASILNPEDMPVTESGIIPDIIVNLHAIPTRSTVGHITEMLAGSLSCLYGEDIDATPFTINPTINSINERIKKHFDISDYSEEYMIDGYTGYKNKTKIFIGPIAYQRMKQMVDDKFHVRELEGKKVMLTRQPTEGRAKDGGKRVGEMERDVLIAHGTSIFANELLKKNSDDFIAYICKTCGYLATSNIETGISSCGICKDRADVRAVSVPYAFKLMAQELMSVGISPRLELD